MTHVWVPSDSMNSSGQWSASGLEWLMANIIIIIVIITSTVCSVQTNHLIAVKTYLSTYRSLYFTLFINDIRTETSVTACKTQPPTEQTTKKKWVDCWLIHNSLTTSTTTKHREEKRRESKQELNQFHWLKTCDLHNSCSVFSNVYFSFSSSILSSETQIRIWKKWIIIMRHIYLHLDNRMQI